MGKLAKWSKEKSDYLKLSSGESIVATYKGFSFTTSKFDPDKEVVSFQLDTEFGEKLWNTSATNVVEFFDEVKPGQRVVISRRGEGTQTRYDLALTEKSSV